MHLANHAVLIWDTTLATKLFFKDLIQELGLVTYDIKNFHEAKVLLKNASVDLVLVDFQEQEAMDFQILRYILTLPSTHIPQVALLAARRLKSEGLVLQKFPFEKYEIPILYKSAETNFLKTTIKRLLSPNARSCLKQDLVGKQTSGITAKIVNMPMELEIKITKMSKNGIVFTSPFQFALGETLEIHSPEIMKLKDNKNKISVIVDSSQNSQKEFMTVTSLDKIHTHNSMDHAS